MAKLPAVIFLLSNSFVLFIFSFDTDYVPMQILSFLLGSINFLSGVVGFARN